jgi:phage shock protein E
MKRITLLLTLLTLLLAGLTACGSSAPAAAPSTTITDSTTTETIDRATLPVNIDTATTAQLLGQEDVVVLDVREQWEYDEGHIPGVVHIPMNDIPANLSQIPTDKTVIVTCRSGNRSNQVTDYLRQNGFTNVHNMSGGILAWQSAQLPIEQNGVCIGC